jgi:ATP-dependent exoDNAse (exonuclease V) alpha subunit
LGALVKALKQYNYRSVLLAPTGRAAKVITNYSGKKAFTIHKRIYRKKAALTMDDGFAIADNLASDTLFIVDEASMISDEPIAGRASLLFDLLRYVYNDKNCKLVLVGDTAQLPPVGSDTSPALSEKIMQDKFGLTVFKYEMTDVLRQQKDSGILFNATEIRDLIRKEDIVAPQIITRGYKDVFRMTGERLPEGLEYAYRKYGYDRTLIICRSNKNANLYNGQIRNRILYREEELTGGDQIMIVKNNYFWLKENEENSTDFIANGDIARIRKVRRTEEMYGLRFADVQIEFIDYAEDPVLDCKILLDTLYADSPALSQENQKKFYEEGNERLCPPY